MLKTTNISLIVIKIIILTFLVIFHNLVLKSQILINEVCPLNHKSLLDDDHSNEDWIELYNTADTAVNLKGYRISDRNDFDKAWVFPDTIIQPKQFLTIFASGKNRYTDDKFIMETSGEGLYYWVNPEGYSFAYQEYEGDFEAKVRINTFQNGDFYANAGIMVREGLDNYSRFVSFVAREYKVDSDIFCKYRDSINQRTNRIEFFHSRDFEYPDVYLQLIRKGNEFILNYIDISGFIIRTKTISINLPNKIYLGLVGNSKNKKQIANIYFSGYTINNENVNYNNLKLYEVYTGHQGKFYKNNILHTNFKIGNDESLFVWNSLNELIDDVDLPLLKADDTYSRDNNDIDKINKLTKLGYTKATPNSKNSKLYLGYTENPTFEFNNILFENEENLKINAIKNSKVYFTINSNEPDTTSFLADNNVITINQTTVFRARAFRENYLPSDIVTQTFFENYKSNLPIISLVSSSNNLYDKKNGILIQTESNHEIKSNLEFINNKKQLINQEVGTKLHGGLSRTYNQKSLRLIADEIYNCDTINNLIFFKENMTNKNIQNLDRIVLRSGGQDYFSTKLRDIFAHQLAKQLENLDYLDFNIANLFINGQYHGITNIVERFDDNFIKNNHKIDDDKLNMMEEYTLTKKGNGIIYKYHYDSIIKLSSLEKDFVNKVKNKIQLFNFLDYIFLNTFITSKDWSGQNHKTWNVNTSPIRFQPYDLDVSLQMYSDLHQLNMFHIMKANSDSTNQFNLFFKIMENDSIRNYFILRSLDKINTSFSTDSMLAVFNPMVDLVKDDIPMHQVRFPESVPNWNSAIDSIRFFLKERPDIFRLNLAQYFKFPYELRNVKINFEKVKVNFNTITLTKKFEGKYFLNQKITLEVEYPKDEKFLYWLVNNEKYSENEKIELVVTDDMFIIPVFELKTNSVTSENVNIYSYPNPTDGELVFEFKNTSFELFELSVNIYDNELKLLNQTKINTNYSILEDNKININLKKDYLNINKGVYYFQFFNHKELIGSKKIVLE